MTPPETPEAVRIRKNRTASCIYDIFIYIFARTKHKTMKRYKVRQVIKMLKDDGWEQIGCKGSHRKFKHPSKKGRVTVNAKDSDTLEQFILNNIWKQAGWK